MKKLTTEEIKKRMYELTKGEYLLLGEYVNAHTKMLVKHSVCKNEYMVTWDSFQRGTRCPKCFGFEKLNNDEIDKRMFELVGNEYIRIGRYLKAHTKMLIKHNLCENQYEVRWNDFQRGSRCPKCSGNEKLNNKEIDKKMEELGKGEYLRLGEYKSTHTKMLIKHNLCGNQYEVTWGSFQQGKRCPKCSGNEKLNNKEIDKRIFELTKDEYLRIGNYIGAKTKILVKHALCGNVYEVKWSNFQQGNRCPKCGGTEKLNNKEIDKKMEELTEDNYVRIGDYLGANIKMLVKHNLCGNTYEVTWSNFKTGTRCPKCSGKEKLNNEEIDKKMEELGKNEYVRIGNYVNNATKMLVKHNTCGNEYEVKWNNFKTGRRCPRCNESKGEKEISDILNSLGIKYISQKRFKKCKYKKTLPFDFYVHDKKSKLLIEFDGEQHFKSVEYFGGEKAFRDTQLRDQIKNDFALSKNIPLLRIPYTEQDNIKQILTNKLKELNFI